MTDKDRAIRAADLATQAIGALVRINYDNPIQTSSNMAAAAHLLKKAALVLTERDT